MQTSPSNDQEVKVPVPVAVITFLVLLTLIGMFNTHPDTEGRPLLLLPDVWKTMAYQKKAIEWQSEFYRLESDLNGLLAETQVGDLLAQSQSAQKTLERAAHLAREIDQVPAPMAVTGLRDLLAETSIDYLEASRLGLRWLNLPKEDARIEALAKLQQAHQALQQLEESQWIKTH